MGMAALAEPLTVKISSKRQITIPAKIYEGAGFKDYALCTWTDKGMFLQPLDVEDEDVTVDILRYLIEEGYEGEDLIAQYQEMKKKIIPLKAKTRPSRTRYRRRPRGLLREHACSRARKVWLLKFASPLHSSVTCLMRWLTLQTRSMHPVRPCVLRAKWTQPRNCLRKTHSLMRFPIGCLVQVIESIS